MHKRLGILVVSERHGVHLMAIAPVARRRNILLYVHISGPGVRLCLQEHIQKTLAQIHVTICRKSARRFGVEETIHTCCPGMLTSDRRPPLQIHHCHKCIVL